MQSMQSFLTIGIGRIKTMALGYTLAWSLLSPIQAETDGERTIEEALREGTRKIFKEKVEPSSRNTAQGAMAVAVPRQMSILR